MYILLRRCHDIEMDQSRGIYRELEEGGGAIIFNFMIKNTTYKILQETKEC